MWAVPSKIQYFSEIVKHACNYSVVSDAAIAVTRIATKKCLPELLQRRASLFQQQDRPPKTLVGPSCDRGVLMDFVIAGVVSLSDYPSWLEKQDEASIALGVKVLARYPVLKKLNPEPSWILLHRKQLEKVDYLVAIMQECAPSVRGTPLMPWLVTCTLCNTCTVYITLLL